MKILEKILFISAIVLAIGYLIILILAGSEKPPEHPLDFQDIKAIKLESKINTVEDGLPFAVKRAHEWRGDAELTSIDLISEGKNEIENFKGNFEYRFEFPYVNKDKPGGFMYISINTESNSINLVGACHDGEGESRDIKKMNLKNYTEIIKKVSEIAFLKLGIEVMNKSKIPVVDISINNEKAVFVLRSLDENPEVREYFVDVDINTYKITSFDKH